jgi:hypothetical protein
MWQSINSYLWMLPPAGCCSPRPCAAPVAAPNAAPAGARSPRPRATPTRRDRGCALLLFARAATWLGPAARRYSPAARAATRPSRALLLPGRTCTHRRLTRPQHPGRSSGATCDVPPGRPCAPHPLLLPGCGRHPCSCSRLARRCLACPT